MRKGLEGIKVIEVGGAIVMPLAGMIMASWGAEVIHVELPGRGDTHRLFLSTGAAGWAKPNPINYAWERVARNKKSIGISLTMDASLVRLQNQYPRSSVFFTQL